MVKNKNTLSIRWLGVFSTVKRLVEKRLLSPYKSINFTGEIEIKGRKKVQIRCCNKDTRISRSRNLLCFFCKIQPSKFDYLVCVYLDKYYNIQGHYIFSKYEVMAYFPVMTDVNGKLHPEYKGLCIPLNDAVEDPLGSLIDSSFENWEKIK